MKHQTGLSDSEYFDWSVKPQVIRLGVWSAPTGKVPNCLLCEEDLF